MPKSFPTSLAAIFFCALLGAQASADTRLGIQAVALTGTHYEPKENVSGTGTAGFIQLDQRWRSVQLHLEGIPAVGTAVVNTAAGPVRATLGIFTASARFRLDAGGRFWFGAGTQVLAQRTPQTGVSKIDASRLAGSRYEFFSEIPAAGDRFVESQVAVMPHLAGIVYETRTAPLYDRYTVSGAETAEMTDLSLAYGIRRGPMEYLFGGRAINFAAKFADGREADRNVGAGLFAAVRFRL